MSLLFNNIHFFVFGVQYFTIRSLFVVAVTLYYVYLLLQLVLHLPPPSYSQHLVWEKELWSQFIQRVAAPRIGSQRLFVDARERGGGRRAA